MEITVIIPNYNSGEYIEDTLNSLLAQTHKNWTALVFDDGSTDNSPALIEIFAARDKRIKLLRHANKGLAQTLKAALGQVKTEYTAFLECDDIWRADYLEQKISILRKNPSVNIIFNDIELFGTPKRVKKLNLYYKAVKLYLKILNPLTNNYKLVFPLFTFNPVATFSCILARAALLENLDFNPPFAPWLDRWLWLQLCFKNKFYFINKKLTRWRLHDKSHTMQTLADIKKYEQPFSAAAQKIFLQNLRAGKFYAIKYISLILELVFNTVVLPVKLIFK